MNQRTVRPRATNSSLSNAYLGARGWSRMASRIGSAGFEGELTRLLAELYRADCVHICNMSEIRPDVIMSLSPDGSAHGQGQCQRYFARDMWKHDPCMEIGIRPTNAPPITFRLDTRAAENTRLTAFYAEEAISERLIVFGNGPEGRISLSFTRSCGRFSAEEEGRLALLDELAFPLLARHYGVLHENRRLPEALTSLQMVQACIEMATIKAPRREIEVVSRVLIGMTAEGIALDLNIGEETVISYRKRFYARHSLGGNRDLLVWYLDLFGQVRHQILNPEPSIH
jgi:DNA-binding CsgD family transcriptional regulator